MYNAKELVKQIVSIKIE